MGEKGLLHYIRISALKSAIAPLLFLALVSVVLFNIPFFDYFNVKTVAGDQPLSHAVTSRATFVRTPAKNLYYAGEDYYVNGVLTGHYYYELQDHYLRFYILKPSQGKPAAAYLSEKAVRGRVEKFSPSTEEFMVAFAATIGWDAEGLRGIADPYIVNEAVSFESSELLLFYVSFLFLIIGVLLLLYKLLIAAIPRLSPAYQRLRRYGNAEEILKDAERDIAEHTLLTRGDLRLTSKYLIEYAEDRSAVIPLTSALWVFRMENMRYDIRRRRDTMFYSMRIYTIVGDCFILKNKQNDDLTTIEETLTDRYPNFFYGYSEDHDRMVHYILAENRQEIKEGRRKKTIFERQPKKEK